MPSKATRSCSWGRAFWPVRWSLRRSGQRSGVGSGVCTDLTPAEVQHCISPALSRLEAATRGETVEFQGRQVDPRYRFSNKTLVDWLGITMRKCLRWQPSCQTWRQRRRDAARHELARREKASNPGPPIAGLRTKKAEMARVLRRNLEKSLSRNRARNGNRTRKCEPVLRRRQGGLKGVPSLSVHMREWRSRRTTWRRLARPERLPYFPVLGGWMCALDGACPDPVF